MGKAIILTGGSIEELQNKISEIEKGSIQYRKKIVSVGGIALIGENLYSLPLIVEEIIIEGCTSPR